ncbi:hypothetical protein DPX16_20556 [Anabarilius grahami]|uniref:Uncharacterized protein n=1 Tax=Anabarilius grahami TaxID=495550 RepID=A0A3N0YL62_ANAGA|nr:hypothetical protein DPX16_20556 [Anabarilius grahami]
MWISISVVPSHPLQNTKPYQDPGFYERSQSNHGSSRPTTTSSAKRLLRNLFTSSLQWQPSLYRYKLPPRSMPSTLIIATPIDSKLPNPVTTSPEPVHMLAGSESVPVFAANPEPHHASADLPEPRHASADLSEPSAKMAATPEPSEIAALAIMATAIWCLWAAHTSNPVLESTPEPIPVHESAPEPDPAHGFTPEPASTYESSPDSTSVRESTPEFAAVPEPSLVGYGLPVCLDTTTEVIHEFPVCLDTTLEVV